MSIPKDILADDITNAGRNETLIGNLLAASMLSDAIKTSFGPCGLEKMYIDIMGESIITKDGGTFLRKIDVEHPSAKVVIAVALATQKNYPGKERHDVRDYAPPVEDVIAGEDLRGFKPGPQTSTPA